MTFTIALIIIALIYGIKDGSVRENGFMPSIKRMLPYITDQKNFLKDSKWIEYGIMLLMFFIAPYYIVVRSGIHLIEEFK